MLVSRALSPPPGPVCMVHILEVLVRRVEQTPTASGDTPVSPCVITACGQLQPDDPSLKPPEGAAQSGDRYEEFPEDEDNVDIRKPEVALQVNSGHLFLS